MTAIVACRHAVPVFETVEHDAVDGLRGPITPLVVSDHLVPQSPPRKTGLDALGRQGPSEPVAVVFAAAEQPSGLANSSSNAGVVMSSLTWPAVMKKPERRPFASAAAWSFVAHAALRTADQAAEILLLRAGSMSCRGPSDRSRRSLLAWLSTRRSSFRGLPWLLGQSGRRLTCSSESGRRSLIQAFSWSPNHIAAVTSNGPDLKDPSRP